MERGDIPSIDNDFFDGDNRNTYYPYGFYYYTRYYCYDSRYILIQTILIFIILIVSLITILFTYKSTIIDPIENIKNTYINIHLILIFSLVVITILINKFIKKQDKLIIGLSLILIISLLILITFLGIRFNLDSIYTKTKFEEYYVQQENIEKNLKDTKNGMGIINNISSYNEKEYYIKECTKLYDIFRIKSYGTVILNFLLISLTIYELIKVKKIKNRKDKLNKDDVILFDEEQNIKV